MNDLKEKTIRGGVSRLVAQALNFAIRIGSLVVLARLLDPKDFGIVGMVTAFTGVLALFRDFGLSSAAVQRAEVTDAQASTLFWINVLVGAALALITAAAAPLLVAFYSEPKLLAVTMALAVGFIVNALGVQHSVMLQRQLRFTALSVITTVSLVAATAVGIGGAAAGFGYWALVLMTVASPVVYTIGSWVTTAWVPGPPRRHVGLGSMVRFGATITMNSIVYYGASNLDKVLVGRYLGVEALGLYGRAYQLISIPSDNVNTAAGEVAFSALSRVRSDAERLKQYFLKGYSLLLAVTVPVTIAAGVFAEDVVRVFLGPKWSAAAPIFRLLAPAMLVFAIVNPLGWMMTAIGRVGRGLKMALVLAPFMIGAYLAGLPYGPTGVAAAYSAVMLLWMLPAIFWAVHDTPLTGRDVLSTMIRPLGASVLGAACAIVLEPIYGDLSSALVRLVLESTVLFAVFAATLLFPMGHWAFYVDIIRQWRRPTPSADEPGFARQV